MGMFMLVFGIIFISLMIMTIGVLIFKQKPIKGTCGGLNNCHCKETGTPSC